MTDNKTPDIKTKAVEQLRDVLTSVEKAMQDIKAGNYDDATRALDQLKSSYRDEKQKQKAS